MPIEQRWLEPVRITPEDDYYFFGYYDKCCWNASGRYILYHRATFQDRPPVRGDKVEIGVIDVQNGHRRERITDTAAWCWQQGAMLQWSPAEPEGTIIYNDSRDDQFVTVVRELASGKERVLPRAVAAVSRDGRTGLSLNFARLDDLRPGYGYAWPKDPFADQLASADDGIYVMDMNTGVYKLIVTVADVARFQPQPIFATAKQWFNHLQFTTDDRRFVFLHRWHKPGGGFLTRLLTADADGGNLFVLNDHDMTSHFDWRDENHLLAFARRRDAAGQGRDAYYLFTDQSGEVAPVGLETITPLYDGHCNYSPDRRWILTDTYPDSQWCRQLLLYRPADDRRIDIWRGRTVIWHRDDLRTDLHPRWSRDGRQICFDSSHEGRRGIYVVDVGDIVGD